MNMVNTEDCQKESDFWHRIDMPSDSWKDTESRMQLCAGYQLGIATFANRDYIIQDSSQIRFDSDLAGSRFGSDLRQSYRSSLLLHLLFVHTKSVRQDA